MCTEPICQLISWLTLSKYDLYIDHPETVNLLPGWNIVQIKYSTFWVNHCVKLGYVSAILYFTILTRFIELVGYVYMVIAAILDPSCKMLKLWHWIRIGWPQILRSLVIFRRFFFIQFKISGSLKVKVEVWKECIDSLLAKL